MPDSGAVGRAEAERQLMPLIETVRDYAGKVVFIPGANLPNVHADPGMVEQVLTNLCVNARDAMPDGGQLTIATRPVRLDEAFCLGHPWARQGTFVEIAVSDTGTGIPPGDLPHVFDRFYRVDKSRSRLSGGSGIGLAIVKAILEMHGRDIAVESSSDAGTVFAFELAVQATGASPPVPAA